MVEFQVKVYTPEKFIEPNHIDSSLELLDLAYTDALIFVITGMGFNRRAEELLEKYDAKYSGRIYSFIISDDGISALHFLALFERIFLHNFTAFTNGSDIALSLLNKIFKTDIYSLFREILNLPPRSEGSTVSGPSSDLSATVKADFLHDNRNYSTPSTTSIYLDGFQPIMTVPVADITSFENESSSLRSSHLSNTPSTAIKRHNNLDNHLGTYPTQLPQKNGAAPFSDSLTDLPLHWQTDPLLGFFNLRGELLALVKYAWKRPTPHLYKFTKSTFKKNIIDKNVALGINEFNELVDRMLRCSYLEKVKTSLAFTPSGKIFVSKIVDELNL